MCCVPAPIYFPLSSKKVKRKVDKIRGHSTQVTNASGAFNNSKYEHKFSKHKFKHKFNTHTFKQKLVDNFKTNFNV